MPGGWTVAALLLALAIGAVVLGLWEVRGEHDRRRRALLRTLRIATAVVAWLVAIQPRWTGERVQRSPGRIAVLADASRSMQIPAEGEKSRAEVAQSLASRWKDRRGGDTASAFAFGSGVRPTSLASLSERWRAREDESRIGDAVASLAVSDEAPGDLGAVVVVSDGADSGSAAKAADLARRGVRVHAVAVGAGRELRDDAIARVEADPVGFLREPGRVRVVVRSVGGGGPIPVTLRKAGEVVTEAIAEVPNGGEAAVELAFTPDRLGRAVYEVTIPLPPGDAIPENNARAFLVRVTRNKLRVLLVAGQPTWDVRFLRAFLKRDPSIDLISFFILRTGADLTMASPDELALIPFPTDELFREHLGSFDLVIFQDFDYGPYQMAPYLPRVRDYVMRGGSFAMIGGELSFGSGGYADTALAEVLPVSMPPTGTPATRALVTERFRPTIEPDLARHPLLELLPDPTANASAWAAVAPLQGANVLTGVRGDARVLLSHPMHRAGARRMPLLVAGSAGRGRTLALGTDSTWRWGITTGGLTGDASAYERFWDRTLRWLARDPALEPARVTTDRERYGPEARVAIEAHLRDDRYQPIADRAVRLAIVDGAGREIAFEDVRTDGEGRARASMTGPGAPAGYRVVARPIDGTNVLAEEGFVVEAGGDELADPRPRPTFLRELAESTGGTFIDDPSSAPDLAELDSTRTRSLGTTVIAPLATLWALLSFLALFGAEWALRRRWGRV